MTGWSSGEVVHHELRAAHLLSWEAARECFTKSQRLGDRNSSPGEVLEEFIGCFPGKEDRVGRKTVCTSPGPQGHSRRAEEIKSLHWWETRRQLVTEEN